MKIRKLFTILSDNFNFDAIVFKLGQKNSDAAMPVKPNKNNSHKN